MTVQGEGKDATLLNSPAEWISPGGQDFRDDPPPATGAKVILNDRTTSGALAMKMVKSKCKLGTILTLVFLSSVIALAAVNTAYADIDFSHVVLIWLFDEGSGKVAKDSSGNNRDGEITGGKWVDGVFGKAIEFDGETVVSVPDDDGLSTDKAFTMSCWVKTKSAGASQWPQIMGKLGSTGDRNYTLWQDASPSDILLLQYGPAAWTELRSKQKIDDNKWHHVAGTRDKDGKLKVYIDGVVDNEADSSPPPVPNNHPFTVGFYAPKDSSFIGTIDEVLVSTTYAYTPDELKSV